MKIWLPSLVAPPGTQVPGYPNNAGSKRFLGGRSNLSVAG
jgi:hypothetical protein